MNKLQHFYEKLFSKIGVSENEDDITKRIEYHHVLNLANLDIEEIPEELFSNEMNFTSVNLKNNKIKHLPDDFCKGFDSIHQLLLGGNSIQKITPLNLNTFRKLRRLDLENNNISKIPAGSISELSNLLWINIATNKFIKFPSELFENENNKITRIFAKNNSFKEMTTFKYPNLCLRELIMDDNLFTDLESFNASFMKNLELLSLNGNKINQLLNNFIEDYPKLANLSLARNELQKIPMVAILKHEFLLILDVRNNNINSFEKKKIINKIDDAKIKRQLFYKFRNGRIMERVIDFQLQI